MIIIAVVIMFIIQTFKAIVIIVNFKTIIYFPEIELDIKYKDYF